MDPNISGPSCCPQKRHGRVVVLGASSWVERAMAVSVLRRRDLQLASDFWAFWRSKKLKKIGQKNAQSTNYLQIFAKKKLWFWRSRKSTGNADRCSRSTGAEQFQALWRPTIDCLKQRSRSPKSFWFTWNQKLSKTEVDKNLRKHKLIAKRPVQKWSVTHLVSDQSLGSRPDNVESIQEISD